jgi:hypothetical protein
MGVTYKALDVDLRRPVTLKVISERYLGDESARLREHPKVALTILANGNLAFTARDRARVVQEPMVDAPAFAAVAIDVEKIDDHRQRELVVEPGVSRIGPIPLVVHLLAQIATLPLAKHPGIFTSGPKAGTSIGRLAGKSTAKRSLRLRNTGTQTGWLLSPNWQSRCRL